jgi:hypothetical protein
LKRIGEWTVEIIKRSDTAQGFEVLPRRWVVERTFSWLGRCRRLAKDFEATIASAVAWALEAHRDVDGDVRLTLWQAMPESVTIGDAFTVTAGCDKTFTTCRDRFGNADNFRGFPHIPGNDFVLSYPTAGTVNDSGSSLVEPKGWGRELIRL